MIAVVLGTRPEAIKLWPVITELREHDVKVEIWSTRQSPDLLPPILQELELREDIAIPPQCGMLFEKLAQWISGLGVCVVARKPACVVVQGDTTTALAGALAAFYHQVPVAHVEAGLRTGRLDAPYPEEGNRRLITAIARWNFAPTEEAKKNLEREGAGGARSMVYMTGNTIVDAVDELARRDPRMATRDGHHVLVTFHRREAWDRVLALATAIGELAGAGIRVKWVLPGNLDLAGRIEAAQKVHRAWLVHPMPWSSFLPQLAAARCVVTDSGGVAEEAAILGVPRVVIRDCTERPETLLGAGELVRLDEVATGLLPVVQRALGAPRTASAALGDGSAGWRIANVLAAHDR